MSIAALLAEYLSGQVDSRREQYWTHQVIDHDLLEKALSAAFDGGARIAGAPLARARTRPLVIEARIGTSEYEAQF